MSDMLKKFDCYCYEMKKMLKYEDFHSPNLAKCRKKLRKMLIKMGGDKQLNISEKLENYWKISYYLPVTRFLKESESKMDTSTLLTVFCGEFHEILFMMPDKYHAQINLYLGDLHRYMSKSNCQIEIAAEYYCKSIELDQKQGRAFNMLAILKPPNFSNSQLVRLYFLSLLSENSYKSENNIKNLVSEIKSVDSEELDISIILAEFVDFCLFNRSLRSEFNKTGSIIFLKIKYLIEKSEEQLPEFLSACSSVLRYFSLENEDSRFIYLFENFVEIFNKLSQNNSLIVSTLEWIFWMSKLLENDYKEDNEKQLFDIVPIFSKNKWEELCDSICEYLNNIDSLKTIFLENEKYNSEKIRISYLVHGAKHRNSPSTDELVAFWSNEISELNNSPIVINLNGPKIFERVNKKAHRKLDLPKSEMERKTLDNAPDSSWKPIYVVVDLPAIIEDFPHVLDIWSNSDFISAISSDLLAQLDKKKNSSANNVRWALREIHNRQKMGKIRIVTAENNEQCCNQLVESATKMALKDHKQIVAFVVQSKQEHEEGLVTKGVTIYQVNEFLQKCKTSH